MDKDIFRHLFRRAADSHKYDYGHALIIGGSPGMVGAPLLCGMAALRVGAGLVTIAAAPDVTDKLERRVKEIMTLAFESEDTVMDFIGERKVSGIVFGPGLKPTPEHNVLLGSLLQTKIPIIIDGGGLTVIKQHFRDLHEAVILTPHTGEFQRLVDTDLPKQRNALMPLAKQFAKKHGSILVLKGEPTYVVDPRGELYENMTGNPGLATAGTGDVLAGMIGGIIAQGIQPFPAAESAVYLHGLAGDIAAATKTQPGMIAGDVIEAIPEALRRVRSSL